MGAGEASGATAQGGKLGGKIKIKKKKNLRSISNF